jgi:hypothetical protein
MKGKLIKDHEGWWVRHDATSPDGNEHFRVDTMLHPDDVKFLEDCRSVLYYKLPDVEFEIVTEVVTSVGNSEEQDEYTNTYAKLISPALKPILIVTDIPTEKILEFVEDMKKGGMVDVPFEGKRMTFKHLTQEQADCLVKVFMFYETNRAQKNTEISKEEQKQLITEIMDLDAKDGLYENNVEKLVSKEKAFDGVTVECTLYTEEDMLNAFYDGWLSKDLIWKVAKKLFKESLKQPKKD